VGPRAGLDGERLPWIVGRWMQLAQSLVLNRRVLSCEASPKVHYRADNRPLFVPTLSQLNPV
jgi:hypothetical protein